MADPGERLLHGAGDAGEQRWEMKERPILFSGAMIRAILAGTKMVTRRIVKGHPHVLEPLNIGCPYGVSGDRLWVRETFASGVPGCGFQGGYSYRADHLDPRGDGPANPMQWKPSIHMPRKASRITLAVLGVRVEHVQDITDDDVWAEGVNLIAMKLPTRDAFAMLWDGINGERAPWSSNPWVWRVAFQRVATGSTP